MAALLHAIVDVPWHRPAVGWLLLVVGLVSLPASARTLRSVWPTRIFFVFCGILLLGGAFLLARERLSPGVLPSPYRWDVYNDALSDLGKEMRYEEGRKVAAEAAGWFPLEKDAYYWMLAYSRGDRAAEDRFTKFARLVEPVLPQLAVGQAALWKNFDDSLEAEAWSEAVRRAQAIDALDSPGARSSASTMLEQGLRSLAGKPNAQRVLLVEFGQSAELLAEGIRHADASLADEVLSRFADSAPDWLDGLPPDLRGQLLERWIALPSAPGAVAYMEGRNAGAPGAYWRQLANYYAKAGDKARAVGIIAQAEGVALDSPLPEGEFARQLAALQEQGNEVAVRRLLKEAAEVERADPDKLRVAMASYAASGDWEMAWKAASRLATATKNRQ
jgi:hypothetical protein